MQRMIILLVIGHIGALAHDEPGNAFAGARVGYLRLEEIDQGSLNVGLTFGYDWGSPFELEGSLDYHTADYDLYGRSTFALQLSLLLLPWRDQQVQFYGVGGIGAYVSDYDQVPGVLDASDSLVSEGGFHAGFGLNVFLARDMGQDLFITLDSRWLFTEKETASNRIQSDGLLATIGIKYRF